MRTRSFRHGVPDIRAEEWIELIRRILEQSIYDVLILDIDEGLPEVYRNSFPRAVLVFSGIYSCIPASRST